MKKSSVLNGQIRYEHSIWLRRQDSICNFCLWAEIKGSAASSRSGQRSSALHLDGFSFCSLRKEKTKKPSRLGRLFLFWLRRQDSNLRPPGYEPDELPTALLRDIWRTPLVPEYCIMNWSACQPLFPVRFWRALPKHVVRFFGNFS